MHTFCRLHTCLRTYQRTRRTVRQDGDKRPDTSTTRRYWRAKICEIFVRQYSPTANATGVSPRQFAADSIYTTALFGVVYINNPRYVWYTLVVLQQRVSGTMNHPSITGGCARSGQNTTQYVVDDDHIDTLLDALDDQDCRKILEATNDQTLSVAEIADVCELPVSTTYRKVDRLTEAELLEEQIRLSRSGKHTNEYVVSVESVQFCVDPDDGITLEVARRSDTEIVDAAIAGAD